LAPYAPAPSRNEVRSTAQQDGPRHWKRLSQVLGDLGKRPFSLVLSGVGNDWAPSPLFY